MIVQVEGCLFACVAVSVLMQEAGRQSGHVGCRR